jgi:hypothetical protein
LIAGGVKDRTALVASGIFLAIAGVVLSPYLCGVGFLLAIIGAVMWAAEE